MNKQPYIFVTEICYSYVASKKLLDARSNLKGVCSVRYRLKSVEHKIDGKEKVRELHLGEENKGVDAGAVGLIHWDRDVQEAVPSSHLIKMVVKEISPFKKVNLALKPT